MANASDSCSNFLELKMIFFFADLEQFIFHPPVETIVEPQNNLS